MRIAAEDDPLIDSPSAEQLARFKARIRDLSDDAPGPLGVAVSGGPDSLALLLLAAEVFPDKVAAATVDHGLREESAAEAALVARYCAELGVPHETLMVAIGEGNVSARARAARYEALADWARRHGLPQVATAHHADDQAETLLLRLNRGSGVAGLAGIRAGIMIQGLHVVRPLLDWRRSDLVELVCARGWAAVDDPSNRDPRYDRARLREALGRADWIDPAAVAASAAHLGEADAALDWMAERIRAICVETDGDRLTMPIDLPRALALRVIARLLADLGTGEPRGADIARMHDALVADEVATLAGVVARPGKKVWRFGKAPERRS